MRRGFAPVWLAGLLALEFASGPALAQSPAPEAAPEHQDQQKAAAKAEVQAARAAFSAGEYAEALTHYEAAMAILPSPKLHYNIAVCHQRLALAAETSEERTRQRDLAIESYNRYLEQNPRAEDRLDVAETIRDLGGTPATMPALKPLFEGDDPPVSTPADPSAEQPQSADTNQLETTGLEAPGAPPEPRKRPYPVHGRFGIALAGGFSPTMRTAAAVDAPGLFAIDLHGGGFLGRERRFLLAAHTLLYSGASLRPDGFGFYGYSIGLLGQQNWVVGREAVQVGIGGVVALTGQGLAEREDIPPPLCSIDRGAQIASRTGGSFAPRFDLGILLGQRRRGMIGVLVQPSFAVFGDGPSGAQCGANETPWTTLGIRRRWQFQLWVGAGFGFRF